MLKQLFASRAAQSLRVKGLLMVAVPLALVVTSLAISMAFDSERETEAVVLHWKNVQAELSSLLIFLGDAEAGQGAYVLTGDESWLQAQRAVHQEIPRILERLDGLIADSEQQERLARLRPLIEGRLSALDEVADEARSRGHFPSAIPVSHFDRGRQLMTSVRLETTAMLDRQTALEAMRTAQARRTEQVMLIVTGVGSAVGVVGAMAAVVLFATGITSRVRVLKDGTKSLAFGTALPALPTGQDELSDLGRQLRRTAAVVTARQDEVRSTYSTLEEFFNLSIDPFCVGGFDGYFQRLNSAWHDRLGWDQEELLAHPYLDIVHPDDLEAVLRELAALKQGAVVISFQFRCRCRDGSYRHLEWMAVPLLQEQRFYAVARDVTRQKEAEEQIFRLNADLHVRAAELAEANKELESFSYSVSHDLRAPLRSIDGFSQVLLEDCAEHLNDEGKEALQRVRKAAATMGQLIDALLALSRVNRGQFRAERVDLSALAATIAAELRQSQPDRQAEFVIAPGLVVEGSRPLLRAALGNLLGNAWKYTQPRATARIEFGCLEKENDTVYFVRDNGVGFDMTYVGKLFGAFQRLHQQTEFGGTGIGLATVQRIIGRHRGRVWAEGEVDHGATFYFTLHSSPYAASPSGMLDNGGRRRHAFPSS